MASELSLPVEVIGCAIVREPDGLALSSRNVRLSADERKAATVLSRALAAGRAVLEDGERSGAAIGAAMRAVVATEPLVQLDYAAVVDADTLEEAAVLTEHDHGSLRLLIAAQVGPGQADRQQCRGDHRRRRTSRTRGHREGAPTRKDRVSRCAAA